MNSFIETLNQCGENFLNFAWPMLWQASLLIAVLFAVDFLLRRRLRASIRYALWLVVLVKLCVPPTLALPTSPAWWLHKIPPAAATKPPAPYTITYDNAPLPEISQIPLPTLVTPKPKLTNAAWSLMFSVSISAALLGWLLVRWWQISLQVRRAAMSERLNLIAEEAQQLIGTKFNVVVKLTTNTMSPAVCGLFRPAILIPQSLAENFWDEQLRAVLLHELVHLRRRDVWVNFLQALLQIFYWWHPLVWLANARIRRVREEAVDDAVMLALRDDAEAYAPTLLAVARLALNRPLASLGLVGILESRHALRQRIERLVDFRAPRHAGLTLISLLGILAFTAVAVPMGGAPSLAEKEVLSLPPVSTSAVAAQNTNAYTTNVAGILADKNFRVALHALEQRNGVESLTQPEVTTASGRGINKITMAGVSAAGAALNKTNPPLILVTAHFFQMSGVDFQNVFSGLQFKQGTANEGSWATASPETFTRLLSQLKSSGLKQISAPRAVAISGNAVTMSIGNGTNETEFDCTPVATNGGVNLTLFYRVVAPQAGSLVTNQFHTVAWLQNQGGVAVPSADMNGKFSSNLVAVVGMEIVTNAARFQQRLQPIIRREPAGSVEIAENLVQDGKLLYESGKLAEAEVKLNAALSLDSANSAAKYYLGLVQQARSGAMQKQTKSGRQMIVEKLDRIRLAKVSYGDSSAGMPLHEVLHDLVQKIKTNDPDKQGINFLINPDADKPDGPFASATPGSAVDVGNILIKLNLTDVRLADVLDAILLVADKPIKYSIQDYGVVFSAKSPESSNLLFTRTFLVGTNIFPARLMRVVGDGTETNLSGSAISLAARKFFIYLGVDLATPPGKSVFFNASTGKLFVKTTKADLDIIERAVQTLIQVEPQIHIKARFYEVPPGTFATLQKNLLQTNFGMGERMGILTGENFATMLRSLRGRAGVEILAEPEVTTTSGRQTEVRATRIIDVVTNFTAVENETNAAMPPQTTKIETGPTLDTVASVLADGVTINLSATAAVTDFLGYDTATNSNAVFNKAGKKSDVPKILPHVQIQQAKALANLWDGETLMLEKFEIRNRFYTLPPVWSAADASPEVSRQELLVFITATIVDPAGNRVHADGQLPFAQKGAPPQPK